MILWISRHSILFAVPSPKKPHNGSAHHLPIKSEPAHLHNASEGSSSSSQQPPAGATILKKPALKLSNTYRHTWKSRHNHFLRASDVKVRGNKWKLREFFFLSSVILSLILDWQ